MTSLATPIETQTPAATAAGSQQEIAPGSGGGPGRESVTVAITRRMTIDNVPQILAWVHSGTDLAEQFPGFLGTGWVRASDRSDEWHFLYRFADQPSLDAWETSPERQWWLESAHGMAEHVQDERRVGIEGWFDEPSERLPCRSDGRREVPPRWKQATMIWVVFFPMSVLANLLLGPVLVHLPLVARVFLTTVVLTPIMTWFLLPLAGRVLDGWLHQV